MSEEILKIVNVSKKYRLGMIGGTTLKEELQRKRAARKHLEDPTLKVTESPLEEGKEFLALDDINITVYQGERVGIIGHNGAGKSTLLKLISRITAPTTGQIEMNGRIASMLEVGTGFHPELSGRENIYMNGAILGMTKAEIDTKIEEIIDFSECRKFIDTPVKRYSSGMYVKLAFSVAAHLDSEIMIMDEVLAVGDMAFQKKCLDKMNEVSRTEGRTILYVSHNMNTIRQLCERCIILDHGKVIFNGDVEEAISIYLGINDLSGNSIDLSAVERDKYFADGCAEMKTLTMDNKESIYEMNSKISGTLIASSKKNIEGVILGFFISYQGVAVTSMKTEPVIKMKAGDLTEIHFEVDLDRLAPGVYNTKLLLSRENEYGGVEYLDVIENCYSFEILQPQGFANNRKWNTKYRGFLTGVDVKLINQ